MRNFFDLLFDTKDLIFEGVNNVYLLKNHTNHLLIYFKSESKDKQVDASEVDTGSLWPAQCIFNVINALSFKHHLFLMHKI